MFEEDKGKMELAAELRALQQQLSHLSKGDLVERVHFLQSLIDAIPTPIFYKDARGVYLGCNTAFAKQVLGLEREQIIGRTVHDLSEVIPAALADVYHKQDVDLVASRGTQVYEAPVRFADGSRRQVLFNKASLLDSHGDVAGMVGVMLDVTDTPDEGRRQVALLEDAQRRAVRLQTAAEVSRIATSLLSLDELLPKSVELIRERFDLYYVGIFLLDDRGVWAVLRAGTGDAGRQMLEAGHRLKKGSSSMIGQCVADAQPRIALFVEQAEARFDNPLLPETKSEMALPLVVRGNVIGAMTIQSEVSGAFTEEDITVLQTMADQLANAIQNARLFEQMNRAVRENETLYNVSSVVGQARSLEDLVRAAVDVASFLEMDGAALRVFTKWGVDGIPTAMDVYGFTLRSGKPEAYHERNTPFSKELYHWVLADPTQVLIYEDLEYPARDIPDTIRGPMLRGGNRSLIMAPLHFRGRAQGILGLFGAKALRALPNHYVEVFARTLLDQVASVLDRQSLTDELAQRASYLAAAADVSRSASSYLDEDLLLSRSADLICKRFDLAYAGLFLLDDSGQFALPRASHGDDRWQVVERSYRVTAERTSGIVASILDGRVVVDLDREREATGRQMEDSNGHLQSSSAALPLITRGEAIGALVIRPREGTYLSKDDLAIFGTLADQLANAIANARLYQASQENLAELQRLQQRYALDMWDEYVDRQEIVGYTYDLNQVSPLMTFDEMELDTTLSSGDEQGRWRPLVQRGNESGDGASLRQALQIRGEPVGLISFEEPGATVDWTEDQIMVLDAVHEQLELALENRLLIDRSQRALQEARQRESELAFLQEISALLNATNDVVGAQAELLTRLREFVSVDQLTLAGYQQDGVLRLLGSTGNAMLAYGALGDTVFADGSGFQWVATNGSSVSEADLRLEQRFREDEALAAQGLASRLLMPLMLGQRILGVLELGSVQPEAFERSELMPVLLQVAAQVASAMERGNLLRVAQLSAEESRRLYEATSDLAEALDAEDVLEAIARHAFPDATACADMALYVTDPATRAEHDWLEVVASLRSGDRPAALDVGSRLRADEMPALALLGEEQLIYVEDIEADRRLDDQTRQTYLANGVGALLIAALSTGVGPAERMGILRIRFSEPIEVGESDLRLYRTVSDQAAVVLSNRQLFQESQARIARQAVAVALANLTTSLSEREPLLLASVDFLRTRFDLYFVGIYLLDDRGEWATLEAGTGEVGQRLMRMGHRVQVGSDTMVGRCTDEGQRQLILDLDPEAASVENPLLPDARTVTAFPLISRGQINGVLTLQSAQRFAFTEEDLATLELMANQLANVIESANLYERSQSSLAETRMLYRIAQQIADARTVQAVLQAAVDGISQRSEPDWVLAGVLEPRQDPSVLRLVNVWNRDGGSLPVSELPLNKIGEFYESLQLEERFVTPDITQDPRAGGLMRRVFANLGVKATAAFQLRVRGVQYGTIMIHSENTREFTTAELSFYENVARQAFVALENINLVEATREQAERRDILNQVLRTASSSLDQPTILQDVGQVIAHRLDMPVMMWEWSGTGLRLTSLHDAGGRNLRVEAERWQLNQASEAALAPLRAVVERRQPLALPSDEASVLRALGALLRTELVEGYAVPLTARDVVYGLIVLGRQEGHDEIDESEREFMHSVGTNVAVALETASLYRDAQETAEKLREVDELKNQFMANMSHELRTPLNSIIGFSRVMLKGIDGPLTDMQQTDLNAIYDSGRHLLNLINDILDISKINAGKMEIVFEPVDLKAMIQSVMSTAMGFVKDKPVKLRTDVPEDLPVVVADSRRIRQVLINLLGNAGKFTEEGFIEVSATYDDYQVIVSVRDTGIGIPPDRIQAVFEQFEQVDSSSTRRYGGTGLGVPLSREFVRLHGGDMWIQESVVGQGTTFCFSLPIGGPDTLDEESGRDKSAMGRVVLTVDDDESVVTLFRRYLEKQGYRVFGLTTGDRVVEEARRLKPYAITLDVIMPGNDGWEVIQQLKADPETCEIPIIVCSMLGDKDKGLSMGVADYLVKPISEEALLEALERIGETERGYVLVVDDSPEDRKLLRRILESAEYRVEEATGGAEGIERVQTHRPSLVILDLMMPEVDGFAVLEWLKAEPQTRQIPVIVVTAKELDAEERSRLQQRVEALLQKGLFDQQQLLEDVSSVLSRLSEKRRPH
ncbi:MAG: GAF domain-containing protein [Anaerolineae bacterium]